MGDSFAAGTTDGPGAFSFKQSELKGTCRNNLLVSADIRSCTVYASTCDVYLCALIAF